MADRRSARPAAAKGAKPPKYTVRFIGVEMPAAERRQAVREMVESLAMLPQRSLQAPWVLRSGPWRSEETGDELREDEDPPSRSGPTTQTLTPLSYREAQQRFAASAWDVDLDNPNAFAEFFNLPAPSHADPLAPTPRRRRKASISGVGGSKVEEMDIGIDAAKRRKPMQRNVRPGKGGRRLSGNGATVNDMNEVTEYLGVEPVWLPAEGGAKIAYYELNRNGNTLGSTRNSGRELKQGETALAQVRPIVELAKANDLVLRGIIVAFDLTGTIFEIEDRGDLARHLEAIEEGWCRNVIWRDGDRVARDVAPAEVYYHRLRQNRVALWLCCWRREVQWETDKLSLRAMSMVSASERDSTTRRLQSAQISQGPMAGRGWLGPTKFGTVRDEATRLLVPDADAWPFILRAFELADIGRGDGEPLSCPEISKELHGDCPMDHDAWRRILRNPFYSNGEFIVNVRGIPVAQTPMQFTEQCPPVPLDRFQRVQDNLGVRKARNSRTPTGEFLLNVVECVHARCRDETNARGQRALVKGAVDKAGRKSRRYRHSVFCPKTCRGKTWERGDLERPLIAVIRQLAVDPELQEEWANRARHSISEEEITLGDEGRRELEKQLGLLESEREELERGYIESIGRGTKASVEDFGRLTEGVTRQVDQLERRLAADDVRRRELDRKKWNPADKVLAEAFLEVMTFDTPKDPDLRKLRARLFQRCVSKVVFEENGAGELVFDIYGPLVPAGSSFVAFSDPIELSRDLLERRLGLKDDEITGDDEALHERLNQLVRSNAQVGFDVVLGIQERRSSRKRDAEARKSHLHEDAWQYRMAHSKRRGHPCWQVRGLSASQARRWRGTQLASGSALPSAYARLVPNSPG